MDIKMYSIIRCDWDSSLTGWIDIYADENLVFEVILKYIK